MAVTKQHVESELATYLEKDNDDRDSDDDHKAKEDEKEETLEKDNVFNYCKMNNVSIHLGNITRTKDLCEMKTYKYYMRVWILLIIPIFMEVVRGINMDYTSNALDTFQGVCCCVILVLSLSILLYSFITTRNDKSQNKFYIKLNHILDIPPPATSSVYDIETKYYGITYLMLAVYVNVNYILGYTAFSYNYDHYWHLFEHEPQKLVVWGEATVSSYIWMAMGLVIASTYYIVDPQYASKIEDQKRNLLERYKCGSTKKSKIEKIEDGVKKALEDIETNTKPEKRKYEIIFADIFLAIIYRICATSIFPGRLLNLWYKGAHVDMGKSILIIYFIIADIVFLAIWGFFVHTIFFYRYCFIYDIMDELSQSIESTSINDVIAWWELRKHYLHTIRLNVAGLSIYVLSALIVSAVCVAMGLILLSMELYGYVASNGIILLYATVLAFCGAELCVSYHNLQLKHVNTLNKERLQFLKYDVSHFKRMEFDVTEKIFDVLNEDIKHNDFPLSLLGVRMNANFMLFLRGVVIAVVVAIIAEAVTM